MATENVLNQVLWIPFHADWGKARESKTRKRGKGERKKGRKKSKKKGKWIANRKTMPQLKWGSDMENSPDNVRQEQGQDGKKKENTAQYIISCDLIYQELVLCCAHPLSSQRCELSPCPREKGWLPLCSRQVLYPQLQFQCCIKALWTRVSDSTGLTCLFMSVPQTQEN